MHKQHEHEKREPALARHDVKAEALDVVRDEHTKYNVERCMKIDRYDGQQIFDLASRWKGQETIA